MAYLNLSALPERQFNKSRSLNESSRPSKLFSVFLSYRHADRQYVSSVANFLKNLSSSIYIDYLDDELTDTSIKGTAPLLRNRIEHSKKLIQLITPNAGSSKWMPWELGLGDGILGYQNVVILPAVTSSSLNISQEYIDMYGYIEYVSSKDNSTKDWAVYFPSGKAVWFNSWLIQ